MNKIDKNVGIVQPLCLLNNEKEENKIDYKRDICTNASNYGATIKNINVGADASVRLQKEHNQNKYKIKTFNKIKSDIVGVGVPDDPLIKNKYTNKTVLNSPTSNTAITLIALIITIIVLLILAGVTLNMVMGESGIFSKANSAKEQTQRATAEEIIKLAVLENEADKVSENNYLENSELKEQIVAKLEEQGYKVKDNNVTYYEDKTINIEDYLTKEEAKEDILKTTNITAKNVQKHPDWYYGKRVTNYTSTNGQNDWRIFYSDGTHIFLITGDYINTEDTNRIDTTATGMTTSGYCVYWNSAPDFQTVDDDVLTRFKAKEYNINEHSGNPNSKCVSTLLNVNNWKKYLDNENGAGKAEKAIGSPTVEMWMDSWNARYPEDKVYRKASNDESHPGYYIGTSLDSTGSYNLNNNGKEGYNNKLYYPHTESGGYSGCNGYWLASPAAWNNNNVHYVGYNGNVNNFYNYYYYNSLLSVRPVVSLKSGVTVNAEDAK